MNIATAMPRIKVALSFTLSLLASVKKDGPVPSLEFVRAGRLTESLNEDRGRVDGGIVTLKFGRDSLDALCYLSAETWKRTGDLHDRLNAILNESISDAPQLAKAA